MDKILRVAAYCRVSTLLDMQEGSFEAQADYYRKKISTDPAMELAGIYGDRGRSARDTKGRPEFLRMMQDCREGKIDLILTKAVSRFARNLADCVETVNELKQMGIPVYFERENLNSMDSRCELMLSIFAAMAQEESNSIRQSSIASYAQQASEGRPYGSVAYGYYRTPDLSWHIKEDEARRVRYAFGRAAEGKSYAEIRAGLDGMERRESTGIRWNQDRLHKLLTNIVYIGDYYSHKVVSLTVGHQVKNRNYRDRYYIEEHHTPLVSRPLFDRVQMMVENRLLWTGRCLTEEEMRLIRDTSWKEGA